MSLKRTMIEVDAAEFAEWMVYDQMSPIGDERADFNAGVITAHMHNIHKSKKSPSKLPEDFMHLVNRDSDKQKAHDKPDQPKQSPEEMEKILKMFAKRG